MRLSTPPHLKQIPEGPIREFVAAIEDLPVDEWNKRSKALQHIVSLIPEGSSYSEVPAWYNSPPVLRHMSRAVSELLKDPRSTVVKRTCASLTQLFNKCQADARYLFKDIMPTILSVHAQTVQVIRQAVQAMVLETIPEVPCKMVMPLWMERLKVDKSRTVRDACALYLGQALQSWGTLEGYLTEEIWLQVGTTLVKSIRDPSPNVRTHARETLEDIMRTQPGHWETLINDPDGPASRDTKLKRWLRNLSASAYENNDAAVEQEELSVASKFSYNSDSRYRPTSNTTSGYRLPSPSAGGRANSASPSYQYSSNRSYGSGRGARGTSNEVDDNDPVIPTSIAVKTPSGGSSKTTGGKRGLGPPLRPKPFQQAMESPSPAKTTSASALLNNGTPPRHPSQQAQTNNVLKSVVSSDSALEPIQDNSYSSNHDHVLEVAPKQQQHQPTTKPVPEEQPVPVVKSRSSSPSTALTTRALERVAELRLSKSMEKEALQMQQNSDLEAKSSGDSASTGTMGPFMLNMQKLKESASRRRTRNSMLMQERFRLSASGTNLTMANSDDHDDKVVSERRSGEENEAPEGPDAAVPASPSMATAASSTASNLATPSSTTAGPPEHMVIAIRLLRDHKLHVDRIMETLKMEMDALRDFDSLLELAGRPTEAEVLDYFESVGLCLDQRMQASLQLQAELDKISRGEPGATP